ncbi:transketolase [Guggenheimella bovis]
MKPDQKTIDTIRFLAVDAINKANSGHPGLPMGAAPMAYTLFKNHLSFNPKDPTWVNRDRFILSGGHGSMLQYALLHLFGYDLSLEDIKNFRQMGSKTPGHPEVGVTEGVEMTTGPLGQGIATAVGFAMAEARLHAEFPSIIDHKTYVICGDGDLMEGVQYEAMSLAGHLKLKNLIVLWDSNQVTIDGRTDITFTENVRARFEAMGFETLYVEDGNDIKAIDKAITKAKKSDKPVLIEVRTIIGYGSPNKMDKSAAHGAPLGKEEAELAKDFLKFKHDGDFFVSDEVREFLKDIIKEKVDAYKKWNDAFNKNPEKEAFLLRMDTTLPTEAKRALLKVSKGKKATRIHGFEMIQVLSKYQKGLFGGSADLAGSNKSDVKGAEYFQSDLPLGQNIHYGIREFAMGAIVNGINLHGGLKSYGSTFLSFSDYMKPAIRLASIMNVPSVFIFTHDSIGVGEDGPTHQPIEQLTMLRSIPGVDVYRPADGYETALSYYMAFRSDRPSAICLSRQDLPELTGSRTNIEKGAYVISPETDHCDLILMATGSELQLCLEAKERLKKDFDIRVVSMLSMDVFNRQTAAYREKVLPNAVRKRFAVEAQSKLSWDRYLGLDGESITLDHFGESAKGEELFEKYGFSVNELVRRIRRYMK